MPLSYLQSTAAGKIQETARELSGEPKGNGQGIFGKRLGLPLCRN